ncbi:hypothetical protein [Mesorhizobium sp. WSM3860]|uniref:hypothetical protein n=1 Tax=Mesorhizobium sp. WSM3860 TaxID=2029403 RepID=UPI001596FD58|nr:hypothetical protein [Mesorhizobium sp. WSM3860]
MFRITKEFHFSASHQRKIFGMSSDVRWKLSWDELQRAQDVRLNTAPGRVFATTN